jgi:hypothetical protein
MSRRCQRLEMTILQLGSEEWFICRHLILMAITLFVVLGLLIQNPTCFCLLIQRLAIFYDCSNHLKSFFLYINCSHNWVKNEGGRFWYLGSCGGINYLIFNMEKKISCWIETIGLEVCRGEWQKKKKCWERLFD